MSGIASVTRTGDTPASSKKFKGQETFTILDQAGNRLEAVFDVKAEGHESAFTLHSLRYNGGAALTLPKNELQCEWAFTASDTLKELEQQLELQIPGPDVEVQAKFERKKNETEVKVKYHGVKPDERRTLPGQVFLSLTTNQGSLGFDF